MKFFGHAFKSAVENILRNKTINLLCFGIIGFTLLVLGLFQIISFNLNQYVSRLSRQISAIFYFQEKSTQSERQIILELVQQSLLVQKALFISENEAYTRFGREFPDLKYILSEFDQSPFPASIEVQFREHNQSMVQIESFLKDMKKYPSIESIQLNTDWAKRIENLKQLISSVGFFISITLLFISIFVIFNVIKLNILYRQDEIIIFQLVGATNFYIRLPFLLEGLLLGMLGGLLADIFLAFSLKLFSLYGGYLFDVLRGIINLRRIPMAIFRNLILVGSTIGFFSALFSLKRFISQSRRVQNP